jgi:hypothetical protein
MFEGGEQGRAKFKVQGEKTEGDEGGVGEEDWELAWLKVAEYLSRDCQMGWWWQVLHHVTLQWVELLVWHLSREGEQG